MPVFPCCLCGEEIATDQTHLEMLEKVESNINTEGMPTCVKCAGASKDSWAIAIRRQLHDHSIQLRNAIIKARRDDFAFDCDGIVGLLLCTLEYAKMGSNGVALEPEAAEFLRQNVIRTGSASPPARTEDR